jgi:hypothetical protein
MSHLDDLTPPPLPDYPATLSLLKRWCLVLSIALFVVLAVSTYALTQSFSDSHEASRAANSASMAAATAAHASASNSQVLKSEATNRVKNVSTWCNAIDGTRHELETFIHEGHFMNHGKLVTLKLTSLDCSAIEHRTVKSGSTSHG